jgi:type I restriction enzyme S subunit
LIRFVVDAEKILPDYVYILTKLSPYANWVRVTQRVTGQPNINAEEYGNLPIPLPPIEIQQRIVDIYKQAQTERNKKYQTAKQQLDSIDDYLLDVLHVDKNQATICSNGYAKNISTILGNRLDVSFYKNRFELISKKYSNVPLSSVAHIDPSINFSGYDANTPISFIPMECVDEIYGEIHVIKSTTILQSKGYTKFEEGDLLWAKITPCMQNGKSAIVKNLENGIGCGSTEFFVLRPCNNNVLIDYIYLLLRHHEVLKAAQSSFGGSAGQQRVSSQYLKSIIIPIPDYSIQKDIVAKIYNMKSQAKQLQKEGDKLLEEAKQKIEKLIFE